MSASSTFLTMGEVLLVLPGAAGCSAAAPADAMAVGLGCVLVSLSAGAADPYFFLLVGE